MNVVLEAILWSVFATVLSQLISVGVMVILGIAPRDLARIIEDEQNPAVGAFFFAIATITSIYVGVTSGDGYDPTGETLRDLAWILGGVVLASTLTLISFEIAHRALGRLPGENTYQYIRRELVDEQNASMAFFLSALAIAPFMATLFQII